MIDLHLHTTASDGSLSPADLVSAASRAGLRTMAVTDHDTTGALDAAIAAAAHHSITCVPGIEVTAVREGRDVHVLAYGIAPGRAALGGFLARQRDRRRERLRAMVAQLADLGAPVTIPALESAEDAHSARALGRPMLAQALVAAGWVKTTREAFDKYLAEGRPAFVERIGPPPRDVFDVIRDAGGLASLAHPVKLNHDDWVEAFIDDGLDAIEVYHPDQGATAASRYLALATRRGLLVTGGSDYHGPGSDRESAFGRVTLPAAHYERLRARLDESRTTDRRDA